MRLKHVVNWLVIFQICLLINIASSQMSYAEDRYLSINNVSIEATIDEAGNMHVVEYDTYTFQGLYNGVYVDLGLDQSDGIENFQASEISDDSEKELAFEVEQLGSINRYKVFSASDNETKTFKFIYTYKNVIKVYEDIAELYWQFFDEVNTHAIDEVNVRIVLPPTVSRETIYYYGYENSNGTINMDEDNRIHFHVSNLGAGELFEVRVLFPPEIVPQSKNKFNELKLDSILQENVNDQINKISSKTDAFDVVTEVFSLLAGLFVLTVNIIFGRRMIKKYGSYYKVMWKGKYMRELPSDLPPAMVAYLVNRKSSTRDLIATLMDLVRKRKVKLTKITGERKKNEDYIFELINQKEIKLYKHEQMLIKWLFKSKGKKKIISIKELKENAKAENRLGIFNENWGAWKKEIEHYIFENGYYEHRKPNVRLKMLLIFLGQFIGFLYLLPSTFNWVAFCSIALLFYFPRSTRRTELGATEYVKWKAFKKFIHDYSQIGSREPLAIHLWEHYYVYAIALNEARRMNKISKLELYSDSSETFTLSDFSYSSYSNLLSTLDKSITSVDSSSGSFSSGGGGGGGGGGRGGF